MWYLIKWAIMEIAIQNPKNDKKHPRAWLGMFWVFLGCFGGVFWDSAAFFFQVQVRFRSLSLSLLHSSFRSFRLHFLFKSVVFVFLLLLVVVVVGRLLGGVG